MKYLIVNADDFGASRGINRGIMEAHQRGILTSTSLLVNTPFSEEAAKLAGTAQLLSVGLHVDLPKETNGSTDRARAELQRQWVRFVELMGRAPTHLDSHHNAHRDPRLLPHFVALAAEHGLPLREHSAVRYFSSFYGRWNGETHPEQISVESLTRMLETEIGEGFTELSCHPGHAEPDYPGSYSVERATELRTLCDPAIRRVLSACSIKLASYHDPTPVLTRVAA
jgi:predicted glycoside hydrolase/deacetylase ChbG (UPF0249 family)